MPTEQLPTYDHPPVIETVLSAQFEPIQGFGVAQLGAFWTSLGQDWPHADNTMPLPIMKERFGDDIEWEMPQLQLKISEVREPSLRFLIRNSSKTRLIQIQNGRLILNWTGESGGEYPRYETLRAEFLKHLEQLTDFLQKHHLQIPIFNQWEVTYQNHVPKMSIWRNASDLSFFKPLGSLPTDVDGCELEDVNTALAFVIPDMKGRLHVSVRRGKRSDSTEVVVLDFTARGPLLESEQPATERLLQGIDLGRETIVRSFRDLMSHEANCHWGLRDGCSR